MAHKEPTAPKGIPTMQLWTTTAAVVSGLLTLATAIINGAAAMQLRHRRPPQRHSGRPDRRSRRQPRS
jgi:hypothetical protein